MKKLAKLLTEEDTRWIQLFEIASNNGMDDKQADAEAWRGLQEEFLRLRDFDGCLP